MRLIVWSAFTGAVYSAGVVGWLLVAGTRPVPQAMWIVAFGGMFPVFGSAILAVTNSPRPGRTVPAWLSVRHGRLVRIVALAALLGVVVAVLVLTVAHPLPEVPPGQPEAVDGRYVLNNHGVLTPVSRQVYRTSLVEMEAGFVGIAMVFYLVAALLAGMGRGSLARRSWWRRQRPTTPG